MFILLGPPGDHQKNHEIGRSIATLMSDEVGCSFQRFLHWPHLAVCVTGADLGVTKATSHPPPWRGSLFHVIIMLKAIYTFLIMAKS